MEEPPVSVKCFINFKKKKTTTQKLVRERVFELTGFMDVLQL